MQLTRRAGQIFDGANPTILAGGHYYLFQASGRGDYGIDLDGQPTPVIWYPPNVEPCQGAGPASAAAKPWPADFNRLLSTMRDHGNNLLRIFLTNSFVASDLYPYNKVNGKLAVEGAVENGHWNEAYFGRLLSFAQLANSYGVALQLSVFNFFDFAAWDFSPWNPAFTSDLTQGWSATHLVTSGANPAGRCKAFMDVTNNNLTKVKNAFIRKLVNTLRGQGNIIFELMNEPRGPQGSLAKDQARFLSHVAGLLIAAFGSWRPLLSVNAFPPQPLDASTIDTELDIDAWQANKAALPHYDAIDIVSYHGLSSMAAKETTCGVAGVSFPFVDRESITQRTQKHLPKFPDKAMIYSTDGAKVYDHKISGTSMSIRDGQIWTSLKNDTTAAPQTQRHQSDLGNWAYWCFKHAFANPGRCHFQNHSSFYRSILFIKDAYERARGKGIDFTPPLAPAGGWTTWRWESFPRNDFKWAVNFDANLGQIVVQVGTVENQADVSAAGATEVGFLRVFTATSPRARVVAIYAPKSVTIRSNGALVIPAVALRLHAVDQAGNVGALVARQPMLLRPGARPGLLEMSATVTQGQRYALILAADVGVQYQNRNQGYGEIIASYPRATLFL
ncbi:MAG TPA: hypothetical protein VD861_11255 [Pyrinomonadaceae bacterium]|nr:hypothetical protein [Pyrinomonadaceae bacterium]